MKKLRFVLSVDLLFSPVLRMLHPVISIPLSVGDGNFHVLIFFRPDHPEEVAEAKDMASSMAMQAIALGGACTGEHGVGVGKKAYLRAELGDGTVDLMALIKTTVDPHNLMNPGKVVDINDADTCKQH
jgi:D-lactate dehydrogenase (cytochrome)